MQSGFIVKIIAEKKIGFIASRDGGRDVFFHSSVVPGDQFEQLEEGQTVSFDLDESQGTNDRPRAAKVEPCDEKRPAGGKGADPQVARHPRARRRKPTWRN